MTEAALKRRSGGVTPLDTNASPQKAPYAAGSATPHARHAEDKGLLASTPVQAVLVALCGAAFGVGLQKAGVYDVEILRGQFVFRNMVMLLTFLAATTTSLLVVTALYTVSPATRDCVTEGGSKYVKLPNGMLSVAVGSFILGIGMAVAGACPGTVLAQLGSGSLSSLMTIAGGVTGALAVGLLHPYLQPLLAIGLPAKNTMYEWLGVPQWATAGAVAGFMAVVIALVSAFLFEMPAAAPGAPTAGFAAQYWHPVIAGMLLGSVQIPLTLLARKNVGSSTSYSVLASFAAAPLSDSPYFAKLRSSFDSIWQVVFVAGVTAGAAFAASTSGVWYSSAVAISPLESFVGGFLLLFGARFANGCTSGHGITGASHQGLSSFLSIAMMFGGAILTGMLFYRN